MTAFSSDRAIVNARAPRFFAIAAAAFVVATSVVLSSSDASAKDGAAQTPAAPTVSANSAPDASASTSKPASESTSSADAFPGFRFWKAPADLVDRWPWGDSKYYPIGVDLFNEWLNVEKESARLRDEDSVVFRGVTTTLELKAKFDGDALDGSGVYRTTSARAERSDSALSALYRVRPFSFALSPSSDGAFMDSLGVYADGRTYFPNSQAMDREFLWSQRGADDKRGHVSFNLEFPNSSRTELTLETSGDARVFVTEGVVRETTLERPEGETAQEQNESQETLKRTWRVYFGGALSSTLTILRDSNSYASERRIVGVRQESFYRLAREGAELTARFQFDRAEFRPREATLTLDRPLRLVSLEWEGLKDSQLEPTISVDGDATKVAIRVPEGDDEALGELKLSAFCPIQLDEDWTLPGVRLEGNEIEWKETTQRLSVVRPLVATSASSSTASQAREAFRTRQDDLEPLTFRLFESTGRVVVKLRALQTAPVFDSATDCLVVGPDVTAKTTLFFNFDGADSLHVTLPLSPDWQIDSAIGSTDDQISWLSEDENGAAEEPDGARSEGSSSNVLTLAFKKAPAKNQPARVTLSARLLTPFNSSIDVDKLCPIDLSDNLYGAHALVLRSEAPSQIKLTTRNGRPFTAPKSTQNFVFNESLVRDAAPASLGGVRLYFGVQTADAVAMLDNQVANYSTTGQCDCKIYFNALSNSNFIENWRLHCEPTNGSRVERVVFFASASSENTLGANDPWTWSTSTEPERFYTATRLSKEEADSLHMPNDCAAYEIRLAASRSVPFDLNLHYQSHGSVLTQIPLLFLPESTNSSFETIVSTPQGVAFWTETEELTESTAPVSSDDRYERLQKAFRYDPTPANGEKTPSLSFTFEPPVDSLEELPPAAWCWFETLDSYYEADGDVRNRATFYIENHGRPTLELTFDGTTAASDVVGVWLDSKSSSWDYDADSRSVVLPLPINRRFVAVTLEYCAKNDELLGVGRLRPNSVTCSLPTLSSVWNAWTPPQYQSDLGAKISLLDERIQSPWTAAFASLFFQGPSESALGAAASRFAERLGDREALAAVVEESKKSSQPDVSSSLKGTALTWGDALGSATVVDFLFRPLASTAQGDARAVQTPSSPQRSQTAESVPSAASTEASDSTKSAETTTSATETTDGSAQSEASADGTIATPFGKLDREARSFTLYIDRLATSSVGVTPQTAIPAANPNLFDDFAGQALEQSGLVLLILDEHVGLLTTNETLSQNNNVPTIPLHGPAILRCQRAKDASALRLELTDYFGRRYVSPELWNSVDNLVNPWLERPQGETTIGWNRMTIPLDRAKNGVYVWNRYFLWGVELFCFVLYVTVAWLLGGVKPSVSVCAIGVCFALTNVATFVWFFVLRGFIWGAIFAWALFFASRFTPLEFLRRFDKKGTAAPLAAQPGVSQEPRPEVKPTEAPAPKQPPKPAATPVPHNAAKAQPAADDETSTQGFVNLNCLTPEERRLMYGPNSDGPDRKGAATMKTTIALVCAALFTLAAFAQDRRETPTPSASVKPSANSAVSPNASETSTANAAAPAESDEPREPYRVFVPIDGKKNPVGDYYWVDSEFYDRIRQALKERPRERNWRIVDALYEGVVNYNSLDDATVLFNLKATYTVVLDSTSATISIPALPLAPDVGVKFDRQTIASAYEETNGECLFEVDDVAPGKHTLELTIVPPQFSEGSSQISLPIVGVPSARLELSTPDDSDLLDVPNARGKIVRTAGRLSAELGAVDRLTIAKQETAARATKSTLDVEQLFMARPRVNQADVRAIFHYQASGDKIKTLDVECDPLYAFSGYCQCDEGEIESVEPPTSQNNAIHVTFKEPIGGAFTLSVNFIARGFSGVGRLQFPKISTRGARSSKSWLAISPSADVDCEHTPPTTVTNAAFQKAWGASDDVVSLAYDLGVSGSASFFVRPKTSAPNVECATSYLFGASEIETRCNVKLDSRSELYRLTLATPEPFVVDSVELFDEQGAPLDKPDYFLSKDGLTLTFQNPFKGVGSLRVVGRTKAKVGVKREFPLLQLREVVHVRRCVRVYCSPDVYLDWNRPRNWTPIEAARVSDFGDEPGEEYRYLDSYELSLSPEEQGGAGEQSPIDPYAGNGYYDVSDASSAQTVDDSGMKVETAPSEDEGLVSVRVNSPRFVGSQWTCLYRDTVKDKKDARLWRAVVDFQFTVESGRVDRFLILSDEAFDWELSDPDGRYTVSETMTSTGARAISLAAKKTLEGTVTARLLVSFKNESENIRLPRFQLAPSTSREDVSGVKRYAFLPERQDDSELRWSIQDMRTVASDSSVDPDSASLTKSTVALAKLGSAIDGASSKQVPKKVVEDSGMTGSDFLEYALGPFASASLSSSGDALTASRARHLFYVNSNREFFGSSSFTIRQNGADRCVLVAPEGYEILEATVNGGRRLVERLDQNRWRVTLDATPYVKRLDVSFKGSGSLSETARAAFGDGRAPVFSFDLLQIENVTPEKTIWICAFDAVDSASPHWRVYERDCEDDMERGPSKTERDSSEYDPAVTTEASDLLFRTCVENAGSLLEAYESDLTHFSSGDQSDLPRLRAWWDRTWRECENTIAQFYAYDGRADVLSERARRALVVKLASEGGEGTGSGDPTSRWNVARYREIMEQKKKLDDLYRVENDDKNAPSSTPASAQNLWTFEAGSSTRVLVGVSDTHVGRVVFASTPKTFDFFGSRYATTAFVLAITAVLLRLFRTGKSSRLLSVVIGAFVALWAIVFFLVGSKQIGLFGAAALAIGPEAVLALRRRFKRGKSASSEPGGDAVKNDAKGSTIEPGLQRGAPADPGTTAALGAPADSQTESTTEVLPERGGEESTHGAPIDYEATGASYDSDDDSTHGSSLENEIFD